jgi:site-specific recombinase XerD
MSKANESFYLFNQTLQSISSEPDRIIPLLSGMDLARLTPTNREAIDEYLRRRRAIYGNQAKLSNPGTVDTSPVPSGSPPSLTATKRKKKPVYTIPQEEEIEQFFEVIESPRDRAIFRIMYHAGLRASEIGLLQLRDYQPSKDRLMITRLKGSNSGIHGLNRKESETLTAWLMLRGSQPGTLFPSRNHAPISRKTLHGLMRVYGERAGWPEKMRHCHVLKHACCTHLLSRGFNVEQVRDWVGHENIQNTMIYARVTNARRDQMAKDLAEW